MIIFSVLTQIPQFKKTKLSFQKLWNLSKLTAILLKKPHVRMKNITATIKTK